MQIVEPDYYASFQCTGPACEDTCCSGMGVVVDKTTFDKYQACGDPELGPFLRQKVVPNPTSTHPASFALIVLEDATCPLLGSDKLCRVQAKLGEDYLSRTCDMYPRGVSVVDGVAERSLYLSCPEAAKLILLNPNPIAFDVRNDAAGEKYTEFPSIDTSETVHGQKPYKHTDLIRTFAIELLQNRTYRVWERMVILGMYCAQLTCIPADRFDAMIPDLTETFVTCSALRQFDATLATIQPDPTLLINVVIRSLEDRIASEYTSPRFLECYKQFLSCIGYRPGTDTVILADNYESARQQFYAPFMDDREYVWENYLVSKAHRDLFPFGPQKSLYNETRTLYQEFIVLATQYLFARTLLVGLAGNAQHSISEADIVRLVQSFSRAIEHNRAYLTKILVSLEAGLVADLANFATLIKA